MINMITFIISLLTVLKGIMTSGRPDKSLSWEWLRIHGNA